MKIKNSIFCGFFSILCLLISVNAFSQSGQKWSLGGNTIGSSDFFGTSNSQPLVFKTNGNAWMTLDINGGLALKSFSGTGSGILTYNIDGKLIMLPFSGNSNLILTGSGYFSDISEISGWRLNNGDLVSTNHGNVGIGTTAPQTKLHVVGDAIITGTVFTSHVMITDKINSVKMLSDSNFTKSASVEDYLKIGGGGNPPIPPTPGVSLEVYGNVLAAGTISANSLKASNLQLMGPLEIADLHVTNRAEFGSSVIIDGISNTSQTNNIYTDNFGADNSLYLQSKTDDFNTIINASNLGRVGIGTTTPQERLDVNGYGRFGSSWGTFTGHIRVGYNHANAVIDNFGDGRLLINYYSGKDVLIGTNRANNSPGLSNLSVGGNVSVGADYYAYNPLANLKLLLNNDYNPQLDGLPTGLRIQQKGTTNNTHVWWDMLVDGNGKMYFTRNNDIAGSALTITNENNVGIGTNLDNNSKQYKLAVEGVIGAWEVNVETTSDAWSDYVFKKDYKLMGLKDVENFISLNCHLPGVPSANEMEKTGINLGEMDALLLKKIEELTLYVIEQGKQIETLKKENEEMKSIQNR